MIRDGNSVVQFSDRTLIFKYDTDTRLVQVVTDRLA